MNRHVEGVNTVKETVRIELDGVANAAEAVVRRHALGGGAYARWGWENDRRDRGLGANAYGCADAVNILYTLNRFPTDADERAAMTAALQSHQDAETGLFIEKTAFPHHAFHTTAHCTAALEVLDARPLHPFRAFDPDLDIEAMKALLDGLEWETTKNSGHIGAGLYAALTITDSVNDDWKDAYFDWLDAECDEATGLWRRGHITDDVPLYQRMGDGFHFLFNYESAHRPYPYPERLIDSCLAMYNENRMPTNFGRRFHFTEIDWVFSLNRASRQTPHRFYEVKAALRDFAQGYADYLSGVDWLTCEGANDLHLLFGTLCCFAELQQALPGVIRTHRPLRLTLDRRAFI